MKRVRGTSTPWFTLLILAACQGSPPPAPPEPARPDVAGPAQPPPDDAAAPDPTAPAQIANATVTQHQSQLVSIALSSPAVGTATAQLRILAGTASARPGTAELAAEVLVAGSDASTGRRSLRDEAARLGAVLSVDVGSRGIWVTLQVPHERWPQAAAALLAAARNPADARPQLERLRDELVGERSRSTWSAPQAAVAHALLAGDPGTNAAVASLLERDATEVRQFFTHHCVPERTVLCVEAKDQPEQLRAALDSLVTAAKWRRTPSGQAAPPAGRSGPLGGVFWAPGGGAALSTASFVLPIADAEDALAADAMVLLACLTLDGVGGRFEHLLAERGLGHLQFRSSWEHRGTASALVLTTQCTPLEAKLAWQALRDARQSLRTSPPNASEVALGLRRATLTARLRTAGAPARVRDRVIDVLRPAQTRNVGQRLDELATADAAQLRGSIEAFEGLPFAMVVFGGQPPADLAGVTRFELLPAGALAKLAGAPPAAQAEAARPWLAPSLEAIGGRDVLTRTIGCNAEREVRLGGEPVLRETLQWRRPAQLERRRELLGESLQTQIAGQAASEAIGELRASLDQQQRRQILREMARHPVALLTAHARGELQFRPVAQREIDGREVLVLEALGGDFERLRIHVDATSRLVRVVESWETREGGLRVYVQESWSDYRSTGGVRAPFHCVTEIDDGASRVETVYSAWEPLFRGP